MIVKRYFILGGGAAALEAARAIRETDVSGLIVMLTAENALPYLRPALTKQLLKNITAADIAVEPASWYDAPGRDILVLTGRTITAINTAKKTITLADGLVFTYDKLVYALGARCFVPPFKGSDRPNVIAIRTAEDARRVRELTAAARSAVVIGGGVLGLEAASCLHEGGLSVTVVEFDKRIMARQVDAAASAHIADCMAQQGVTLLTSASVASVEDGQVTLADGRVIPADVVIVSAGVRANVEIAQAAGIRVDRKVIVDEHMATSAPDVYAAGDCAAFGMSYALWAEACEMGRVAGLNAAGAEAAYQPVARPVHFAGFGTEVFAIGDPGLDPAKTYDVGKMPDARYYSLGDTLVGAVLTGDTSRAADVEAMITGR